MKGIYSLIIAVIIVTAVIAPLRVINTGIERRGGSVKTVVSDGTFRVLDSKTGKIEKVEERDYVIGVLAGEMSPDNEKEALRAQAVAAYTFACYKREAARKSGAEYDLTSDPSTDQYYVSKTEQVALWQKNYEKNRTALEEVTDSVKGKLLTFGGEPILAAYHSVSSGKTEEASTVWGGNYPYLVSVESSSDLLAPDYLSTPSFTSKEFADKALDLGITLVGEPKDWLTEPERSKTGTVLKYKLAGHEVKGSEMRKAFGLASANFDLTYTKEKFCFTVRGRGHGVGMSQYGAVHMASQGSSYEEILAWYYPNTVLLTKDK